MLSVLLALALSHEGFDPFAIGLLVTVSLLGDLCGTYSVGVYVDAWGRRRTLIVLAALMTLTGIVFATTTSVRRAAIRGLLWNARHDGVRNGAVFGQLIKPCLLRLHRDMV